MPTAHDHAWFPPGYRSDDIPFLLSRIFGLSPAVARALGLPPHTVKAHCQQLAKAIGTTSRARLCAVVVAAVWRESLRDGGSNVAASG